MVGFSVGPWRQCETTQLLQGPHLHPDCPPPLHHRELRRDPRPGQGSRDRARDPLGAAGQAGIALLQAVGVAEPNAGR